jgi:hypothetical protein
LFDIQNFDSKDMLSGLQTFATHDNHYFATSTGAHGSGGLKVKKTPPVMTPMDILNESCPQNSSFLEAWSFRGG